MGERNEGVPGMSQSFGIISGAGPMAGLLLYRRIIELLQAQGAWQDSDFPAIFLMNVSFSDMFSQKNHHVVRFELIQALETLRQQACYIYIACQTLHAFLSFDEMRQYGIVSLIDLIRADIRHSHKSIRVVASKTSRALNLHDKIHESAAVQYLNPVVSDKAIDIILRGLKPDLTWLIQETFEHTVVLGCTEFSVSCQDMRFPWIDPIQLAALDVVKKFTCEEG
jgi:aspartate/glutamate racemase